MAFTKFASFEVSEILDLKGSASQSKTASLDKLSDFADYRTEDGYLYARIRAISSRVNKNHDGWPSVELAGSPEIFDRHHAAGGFTIEASRDSQYGFSTFLGKPIFVDHHNSNPDRARGVIVDAKLHVEDSRTASALDPYYASAPDNHKPPTWVELLLEVDARAFPRLAKAIIEGAKDSSKGIDGFSMGCNVEMSKCSHCGNEATSPDDYCQHIRAKGAHFDHVDHHGHKTSKRSYEDCYGIQFFEISAVFDPADETALTREVRASIEKEADFAGPIEMPCPHCKGAGVEGVANGGLTDCPACQGSGKDGQNLLVPPGTPTGNEGPIRPETLGPLDTDHTVNDGYGINLPQHNTPTFSRTAGDENPLPQADLLRAPEQVNTLRDEKICPVCGEQMDDTECPLCGHVDEPEGFDNPDLTQAQDRDQQQPVPPKIPQDESELRDRTLPHDAPGAPPTKVPLTSHVTGDMAKWTVLTSKTSGRINTGERPIRPGSGQATNEPQEQVISDQTRPVTSSVRTAADFIAAAGRETGEHMKTADAASGAPEVATPDKRVDVEGVGGVMDPNNESASKADAQVDVSAVGGTGVEDVAPDSTNSIEETSDNAGFDTKKNIEAIPTQTFDDGSSAVERQAEPVSGDPFPASEEGVKQSHDSGAYPSEDGGLGGGSATQGVQPVAEQFGERVDVLDSTTSPTNNSGPTTTWSGTDGNGVTKQVDPVTPESIATEGFGKGSKAHLFRAMQLAEFEVDLGLTTKERKFARVAELAELHPAEVEAEFRMAHRVKTAGLGKTAARTAKRMPVMGRSAAVQTEASVEETDTSGDSGLFL